MIEAALVYLVGVVVLMGAFVIRVPHGDVPVIFLLSLFWPVSLVFMAFIGILWAIKWDFDVARSTRWFGFRKPGNTEVIGFAVAVFTAEFQFWKKR